MDPNHLDLPAWFGTAWGLWCQVSWSCWEQTWSSFPPHQMCHLNSLSFLSPPRLSLASTWGIFVVSVSPWCCGILGQLAGLEDSSPWQLHVLPAGNLSISQSSRAAPNPHPSFQCSHFSPGMGCPLGTVISHHVASKFMEYLETFSTARTQQPFSELFRVISDSGTGFRNLLSAHPPIPGGFWKEMLSLLPCSVWEDRQ